MVVRAVARENWDFEVMIFSNPSYFHIYAFERKKTESNISCFGGKLLCKNTRRFNSHS